MPATPIALAEQPTIHGPLFLAATEAGLCRVTIPGAERLDDLLAWLDRAVPGHAPGPDDGRLAEAGGRIAAYLEGEPEPLALPVDLRGTPFQCAVWRAVRAIPYGETRSYAEIAREVGRPLASRAVGAANAINPLAFVIPCQRVIGTDGSIKGYPGGIITRAMLLAMERQVRAVAGD